jgi:hypothetical protein
MMKFEMWVEGTTPILLHRATEEALMGETRKNTIAEREDPRNIAERAVYRLRDRQLAIPGGAFARMCREAGGAHKAKGTRKSLKYIIPAAVIVLDDLCPLFMKDRKTPIVDFEVDARPVTIPATKGRVMRYRARCNEWATRATIQINETIIADSIVRQLMTEGGQQIGVGDFRPERGGSFGVFGLTRWDLIGERPKTEARKRNGGVVEMEADAE